MSKDISMNLGSYAYDCMIRCMQLAFKLSSQSLQGFVSAQVLCL